MNSVMEHPAFDTGYVPYRWLRGSTQAIGTMPVQIGVVFVGKSQVAMPQSSGASDIVALQVAPRSAGRILFGRPLKLSCIRHEYR